MHDDIALRLQQVRQMYGLSQRELAKRAGVTNSSVSMIEQGRVSPSVSSLEKLLKGIPMSLRDFFNLDPNSKNKNFYRSFEIYRGSLNGVDSYSFVKENASNPAELVYQVFNAGTDTGESMHLARQDVSGFVVQGLLEVTVNNQCESLGAGDGFFVEALFPYRFRNISDEKSIVVTSHPIANP
jgi:transcriptional regulator with XRE-family HTH domain